MRALGQTSTILVVHDHRLHIVLPGTLKRRLTIWSKKHLAPFSRVIRNVLEAVPWWDDTVVVFCVAVPKTRLSDPAKLRESLEAATEAIVALASEHGDDGHVDCP